MVMATMADSEREELEQLIEDWNASRLDMFTISKPDANLEFSGNMRFYFQEPGAKDRKVSTKVLRVRSSDTTEEVMKVLVSKFHPDLKMLTMPKYSLYEVHETGAEAHKLELDQRPLFVQLYWQQDDRDGRFLLKSEDDQLTHRLFEGEESDKKPQNLKSQFRISKRGTKKKGKKAGADENDSKSLVKTLYEDQPASSFNRTKSNPEGVMRRRREQKLERKLKEYQQNPENSGGGGGPLRIFAESLQPEIPYKTLLFASNDTTETVLKTALEKYEVPPEEMDQYCLTMVTIAPGNQSDPESSSGSQEMVVRDEECPVGIAASWPEWKGELRFYLKKKENLPKRKQPARQRHDGVHAKSGARRSPTKTEPSHAAPKETTFDVSGNPPAEKEPVMSSPVHVVDVARDLPATLEFHESGEDAFFAVVVSEVNGSAVNFKLAPTFTLYMCCRYRLSPKFRPDFPPSRRREKVAVTAAKIANKMWQTVKELNAMAGHLAFWMANSSEFLNFLKQDVELSGLTEEGQNILAHTTQRAFRLLVDCIKAELQSCLPAFFDPSDESEGEDHVENGGDEEFHPMEGYQSTERSFKVKHYGPNGQPLGGDQWIGKRKKVSRPVVGDVLHTLKAAMSLLRRCRVNPALTIQLFSQVFHFVNMWLFNRLVLEPQLRLCTRSWGVKLLERLGRLQDWAESQGLELAAECHLARITQAAFLLQIPKQDTMAISSHCFKLNSLQLRQLLELYQPERGEPAISLELIEKAVSVAENTADESARSDGQEVRLEEEPDLHLPFLLPDDGYSSEKIRGVPPGLKEFLDPLITPGLCRLTIQPKASGHWTVYFKTPAGLESPSLEPPEQDVVKIAINKGTKGMGVSIVAAKGIGHEHSGIYVKEIIDGGPAAIDGRLQPGDQILDVNGESLVGIVQEDAVKILKKSGSVVHMTVAKNAVLQNGLGAVLDKPTVEKKVEPPIRAMSPSPQKKETPRAPPRYRPPQDSLQRSPPLTAKVSSEIEQPLQTKPEPPKRRSAYDSKYNDWKTQMRNDGPPEQAKTVVEEVSVARKPMKAGVPLPYANPLDIQQRQREMQQRKMDDERREQERETFERERIAREQERIAVEQDKVKKAQEERETRERMERERIKRAEAARREQEREERERIEKEQQERRERDRLEREEIERRRMEREELERQRIEREEMERRRRDEWEKKERERIHREENERKQRERERMEREELERKRKEEREKRERERIELEQKEVQEQREREEQAERERRMQSDRNNLDEMSRRERELQMMIEQKRREKERRLKELERQLEEERKEADRMEQEWMERLRREREERKDPKRIAKSSVGSTQVHYVRERGNGNDFDDHQREPVRIGDMRSNRPVEFTRRGPTQPDDIRANADQSKRGPIPNNDTLTRKRPTLQESKDESFEMDPAEVERQFQLRLAQESAEKSEVDGGYVKVIRVPVQQDIRGSGEDRLRARVDWQKEEEERNRKEQQLRREQDEQLIRDFQQNESFRQQAAGPIAEPAYSRADWEKEEELRRQREEDDRLREARANQLRNRNITRPEDDENDRDLSLTNGRTRRVKFASVRTEIIQPSPDAEVAKPGVKFVHDGKVEDSDDEEFPRPPPPIDDVETLPPPPPSGDQVDYYQRPPPPPKPQNLTSNGGAMIPEYHGYRDNEHVARARPRIADEGYATYPGPARQQLNNNYPVPKPRGGGRETEVFAQSASPDQARLPFKDKMKMFNETTPPKRQTASKWEREQRWANGDSL